MKTPTDFDMKLLFSGKEEVKERISSDHGKQKSEVLDSHQIQLSDSVKK